jgi:hypothetical protein
VGDTTRDGDELSVAAAAADEEPAAGLRGGVRRKEGEEGALVPLPMIAPPPPPPAAARGAGASGRRSSLKNRCDLSLPPRLPPITSAHETSGRAFCENKKESEEERRTKENEEGERG